MHTAVADRHRQCAARITRTRRARGRINQTGVAQKTRDSHRPAGITAVQTRKPEAARELEGDGAVAADRAGAGYAETLIKITTQICRHRRVQIRKAPNGQLAVRSGVSAADIISNVRGLNLRSGIRFLDIHSAQRGKGSRGIPVGRARYRYL